MAHQQQRHHSEAGPYSPVLDDLNFLQRLDDAVQAKRGRKSSLHVTTNQADVNQAVVATPPRDEPPTRLSYETLCHQVLENAWLLFDRLLLLAPNHAPFRLITATAPNNRFRATIVADGRSLPLGTPASIRDKAPILMAGPGGKDRYEAVELLLRLTERKIAEKMGEYPRVSGVPAAGEDLEWVVVLGEGEMAEMDDESSSSESDLAPPPYRPGSVSTSSGSSDAGPGCRMGGGRGAPPAAGGAPFQGQHVAHGALPTSSAGPNNGAQQHGSGGPSDVTGLDGAALDDDNASDASASTSEFWLRGRSCAIRYHRGQPIETARHMDEEVPSDVSSSANVPQSGWSPLSPTGSSTARAGWRRSGVSSGQTLVNETSSSSTDEDDNVTRRRVRGEEYWIRGRPYQVRYQRRCLRNHRPNNASQRAVSAPDMASAAANASDGAVAVREYRAQGRAFRVQYQQGSHSAARDFHRWRGNSRVRHGQYVPRVARAFNDLPGPGARDASHAALHGRPVNLDTGTPNGSEGCQPSGIIENTDITDGRHDSYVPNETGGNNKVGGANPRRASELVETALGKADRGCEPQ